MNSSKLRPEGLAGYIFGRFRVDLDAYRLWRDDQLLSVTPKAFDTLTVLIANRDRVVSKDELMGLIWPESFVSEDSLTQSVSVLRRMLGDDPSQPQFIATSARHGYRFIAPVQEIPSLSPAALVSIPTTGPVAPAIPAGTVNTVNAGPTAEAATRSARPQRTAFLIGVPVAFAAVIVGILLFRTQAVRPISVAERGPLRFTQEAPRGTSLISGGALSPDGRYLAFVAQDNRSSVSQLWIRALDASEPRALPGTEGAARPFWAPDNQHLGFFASGKLRQVGLDSQPPRRSLPPTRQPRAAAVGAGMAWCSSPSCDRDSIRCRPQAEP